MQWSLNSVVTQSSCHLPGGHAIQWSPILMAVQFNGYPIQLFVVSLIAVEYRYLNKLCQFCSLHFTDTSSN